MDDQTVEAAKRRLMLGISEILAQRGLISGEEKIRMREQIFASRAERMGNREEESGRNRSPRRENAPEWRLR